MPFTSSHRTAPARAGGAPASSPGADGGGPDRWPSGSAGVAALAVLAAAVLLSAPSPAGAQETPDLSFDAFGTLGLVHSTEDQADFVWNPFRADGPGHSETVSPDVDSRVGGQLTLRVLPELTAVVQAVVEQNQEDEYRPRLEWAYVEYAITRDLTVRAGRTTLPSFLVSDHRKVSYANPWVRPPVELYGLVPVFNLDGIDARYRFRTGEWTSTLQATFGRIERDLPGGSEVRSENDIHVNYRLQRGGLTARMGFARGNLTVETLESFFDAFRQFGPVGDAVADRYEVEDTPFEFATLGAEYDPGRWFVIGEGAIMDFNSVLGTSAAGYVTGGLRMGAVAPYVTYSRRDLVGETSLPGLPVAAFPPELAPTAARLNATLDAIRSSAAQQQNLALGARWDVATGIAVKAQVDFIDMLRNSPGTFDNQQPGFERGGSAQLFSLSTSFVY